MHAVVLVVARFEGPWYRVNGLSSQVAWLKSSG